MSRGSHPEFAAAGGCAGFVFGQNRMSSTMPIVCTIPITPTTTIGTTMRWFITTPGLSKLIETLMSSLKSSLPKSRKSTGPGATIMATTTEITTTTSALVRLSGFECSESLIRSSQSGTKLFSSDIVFSASSGLRVSIASCTTATLRPRSSKPFAAKLTQYSVTTPKTTYSA